MRCGRWLANGTLSKGSRCSKSGTANFLIYEMFSHLDLLRNPPDDEYSKVGVSVGRGFCRSSTCAPDSWFMLLMFLPPVSMRRPH